MSDPDLTTGFGQPHQRSRFNLVDEPWLPVSDNAGVLRNAGLNLLRDAHLLQLSASDPALDEASSRLLIALGYLIGAYDPALNWQDVADGAPLPPDAVTCVLDRIRPYMNLWDPHHPAFQELRVLATIPHKGKVEQLNSWQDIASGPELLAPHLPANSETVWSVPADTYQRPADDAELARRILVRHYISSSGNVTANLASKNGSVPGSAAGVHTAFNQTFVRNIDDTLARTIAVNQLADWQDRITAGGALYWEAPDADLDNINNPLWSYTATCSVALLGVDHNGQIGAVRTTPLVPKEQLGQRRDRLWRNDPHLLRQTLVNSSGEAKLEKGQVAVKPITIRPGLSPYQWLRDMLAASGHNASRLHTPSVLAPHATVTAVRHNAGLVATSLGYRGTTSGRPIDYIERIDLDPDRFRPIADPDRFETVLMLLEQVGGNEKSVRSTTRYAVRSALDQRTTPDGFDQLFYQQLDPVVGAAITHALHDPDPDDLLNTSTLHGIFNAAVATYDQLCGPYDTDPQFAARIDKTRTYLRGKLWTLLKIPPKDKDTTGAATATR